MEMRKKMKVKELIEELQKYGPDLQVFVLSKTSGLVDYYSDPEIFEVECKDIKNLHIKGKPE